MGVQKIQKAFLIIFLFTRVGSIFCNTYESYIDTIDGYRFEWDYKNDLAKTISINNQQLIWKGSLLPAFWICDATGQKEYIKASVISKSPDSNQSQLILNIKFAEWGNGSISICSEYWGVSIADFHVTWTDEIPEIIDLYFGTSSLPAGRQSLMDEDNPPFTSDWDAFGYCVPGAKGGTAQSFFRMWDFGQSSIALGSFGPSMGTPYGAAFPRPVLFFALGNDHGMMSVGAGNIPDAPMTLKIRSTLGCLNFLYREDIWGAGTKERHWKNPLRIAFGENAYQSFQGYFKSFPIDEIRKPIDPKSIWNTWGNWRHHKYPIKPIADFVQQAGAEILVLDDSWEMSQGLGRPNLQRFPSINKDLDYIHAMGMAHGIWETLGWISDTLISDLGRDDLICDKNGIPCIGNWNFNPFATGYFCLDISSVRSREFLKERTIRTMKTMKPSLIKLDFGYGLPNPNIGVPRNPAFRGENYSFELLKLIVETAKSVNPDVIIMYYGISPIYLNLSDIISLDDQGDMWYSTKEGHDQWSTWASLISTRQTFISGSSSYDWQTDDHVILNSIILGCPGSVLGTQLDDGSPVPIKYINRRLAFNTWYRKNPKWKPLWLNSHLGDFSAPTSINCIGRVEEIDNSNHITALVLKGEKNLSSMATDPYEWEGRWALVSQTDEDISRTRKLALIPFDAGYIQMSLEQEPRVIYTLSVGGMELFVNWKWKNGVLRIQISEPELEKTAGYLLEFDSKS